MTVPQAFTGVERGMVRSTKYQIALRNALSRRFVYLKDLLGSDGTPDDVLLRPTDRPPPDSQWRVLLVGGEDTLLTIALPTSWTQGTFQLPPHISSSQRLALAAQMLEPVMPQLCGFFEQDLGLRLEEASQGMPTTGPWVRFQLYQRHVDLSFFCYMAEAFAPKLIRRLEQGRVYASIDPPVSVFAGSQLSVPVRSLMELEPGTVLLCDDEPWGTSAHARLFVESSAALRQGRYLATVRTADGRVEHLSPAAWTYAGPCQPAASLAVVDAIEARMTLSAKRCSLLAIGHHIGGWQDVQRLEEVQLCTAGRPLARARRTRVAGRPGFEIQQIHQPQPA